MALATSLVVIHTTVYRPDSPMKPIAPGSSATPSFAVQVIRPRAALPLGGLLPPQLFGVDAALGFDSESPASRYLHTNELLNLSSASWRLCLVLDKAGTIQSESEVVFDVVFQNQIRRVRCKPAAQPLGTFQTREDAPNEFSGTFVLELPFCEDAETRQSLGWPPRPFLLRGSFDRLPRVGESDTHWDADGTRAMTL